MKVKIFILIQISFVLGVSCSAVRAVDRDFRAKQLLASGNYVQAADVLKKSITVNPKDAASHYLLGLAFLALHQNDQAAKEFQTTVTLDPDSVSGKYSKQVLGRWESDAVKFRQEPIKTSEINSKAATESSPTLGSKQVAPGGVGQMNRPSLVDAILSLDGPPETASTRSQFGPASKSGHVKCVKTNSTELPEPDSGVTVVPLGSNSRVHNYQTFDEASGNPIPLLAEPKMLALPGSKLKSR